MVPKARKKKWMLLGILLLFLCLICGCGTSGGSDTNIFRSIDVRRINSTAQGDDYFLKAGSKIWTYSVSGQEVEDIYRNGQDIVCYAADNDYVFL